MRFEGADPSAAENRKSLNRLERPVSAEKINKTALLLGASRGLGLGLAHEYLSRGWRVIATARGNSSKLDALAKGAAGRLRIEQVDIADTKSVAALRHKLSGEALDLLFVVAGISGSVPKPLHEVTADEAAQVYLVNAYYPIVAAEAFADLVKPEGVFAFMSSRLASIASNSYGSWETYRTSKAALNMGVRSFFWRHQEHPVLAVAPGWVRTDMGGASAEFDVETSCRNVAGAIEKHSAVTGNRFVNYDGSELPW
jgi:NAD(P)-dependent dehydrogenase (short-subunit alcohol dehydrogenase family)